MPNDGTMVFAFIDSQNLNLGIQHAGWELDFAKFRRYLRDKHRVTKAYLFIGLVPGGESLYEYLQRSGFEVVFKPTTTYTAANGKATVKGNVDTDVVLYAAAKEIDKYDKAVIVSGDGDYLSLYEYLESKNKLGKILIPNKFRFSQLLTKYADYFDYVSVNRTKLEKDKK
jgi:uncharacterized LabA/DUF88 family protein